MLYIKKENATVLKINSSSEYLECMSILNMTIIDVT